MSEVICPSGAKLKLNLAPFAVSKKLQKVCAKELETVRLDFEQEVDVEFFKNIVCKLVSSDIVEGAFWECAARCLYNNQKVVEETFEPELARQDYLFVMIEIARANLAPFIQPLLQKYAPQFQEIFERGE